jgi:hypothetical protein
MGVGADKDKLFSQLPMEVVQCIVAYASDASLRDGSLGPQGGWRLQLVCSWWREALRSLPRRLVLCGLCPEDLRRVRKCFDGGDCSGWHLLFGAMRPSVGAMPAGVAAGCKRHQVPALAMRACTACPQQRLRTAPGTSLFVPPFAELLATGFSTVKGHGQIGASQGAALAAALAASCNKVASLDLGGGRLDSHAVVALATALASPVNLAMGRKVIITHVALYNIIFL